MHQRKYALELIFEDVLSASKPANTPMYISTKFRTEEYDPHTKKENDTSYETITDQFSYQRL